MIVIQGKNEKAVKLERFIKEECEAHKVLILDSVGYNNWSVSDSVEVWTIEGVPGYKEFISEFKKNYEAVEKFDTIAFYINADVSVIDVFKEIDYNYAHNFIVTVQTDEDDIKLYIA